MTPYSPQIWQHFRQPYQGTPLDPAAPDVGSARIHQRANKTILTLALQVKAGRIIAACFKAYGNGMVIACASWLCSWSIGKNLDQARALHNADIAAALALAPEHIAAAVATEQALQSAVDNYLAKQSAQV